MATLIMIRRVRGIQTQRGPVATGFPTRFDIRLGNLLSYLRHRHHRDTGHFSPI